MPASQTRFAKNPQNAPLSAGPRTAEAQRPLAQSAFKHGLTGAGVALPNEEIAEVERRFQAYREELQPTTELGETLVRRSALLSVRLDRCVSHETGRLAGRIRQAEADFVAPAGADAATIAQLKAEAKARAMFDPSPEATLARKYEAATERGFYRALKEFRQIERPTRATETPDSSAAFRELLASFSQIDAEGEALEARYLEPHERTRALIPQGFPEFHPTDLNRPVDVPLTIGRRR